MKKEHFFTKESLQKLKSDINLVFVIGAKVKLIKKGSRFLGRCPLCNNNKPTLVISPKKQLWYCHGRCKKGGSIVDYFVNKEKVTVGQALKMLAEIYPFLAQEGQLGNQGLNQAVPAKFNSSVYGNMVLQTIEYYHDCLVEQKKAIRYLQSIGITHGTIKKYKIGYCNSTLSQALLDKKNRGNEVLKDEMLSAGFLQFITNLGIKERFDGQIVFPLFDKTGQCSQLYGRQVPENFVSKHLELLAG